MPPTRITLLNGLQIESSSVPTHVLLPGTFTSSIVNGIGFVGTSSYAQNADLLDGLNSTVFATTGSNTFSGNQLVTGSVSGSSNRTLISTGFIRFLHPTNDGFNSELRYATNESLAIYNNGQFTLNTSYGDLSPNLQLRNNYSFGWSNTTSPSANGDVRLWRDAAGILAQHNTTNAQTYRIYNTYTDVSNFERGKLEWSGSVFNIGTEHSGSAFARALSLQTSGSTRLFITPTGNIGIGTTNPQATLQIQGNVSASSYTSSISNAVGFLGTSSWAIGATSASYIEFTNIANRPTLVSSSIQINTGSFSGSFTGELIGTSSWATNAVSSSVSLRSAIISTGSAPSNPISDELWYDDTTGKTYIYYVSASVGQWVLQSDPTYDPGPSLQNLQDVTDLGAITNNAITITNTTPSTSNTTGALIVSGGLGVSGSIYTTKVSATQISGSVVSASAYVGQKSSIIYVIDGGGLTIQTGVKGDLYIPFDCTVNEWVLLADQAGSIVIDVWSDVYGSYPPTGIDSIAGTDLPTLSSVSKNKSTTLTGWNPNISAGNTLRFNVNSVTSITRVTLTLNVTKT